MSFGYQILGFGAGGGKPKPLEVDYLIVAGGGCGGGGGGGGGGMRTSFPGGTKISLECICNPITVGVGVTGCTCVGAGGCSTVIGAAGTFTSAGGGKGEGQPLACTTRPNSRDGGAGGAGTAAGPSQPQPVGQGNVPPVSPPQGAQGGARIYIPGGGGGGGGASGVNGTAGQAIPQPSNPPFNGLGNGGPGGSGTANSITGGAITYAGGGGGFAYWPGYSGGSGGSGGGGNAGGHSQSPTPGPGQAGTDGLGGGGANPSLKGGNGVTLLRYPTACAPRVVVAPGCNTTATTGCCTVATFTVTGTLTLS